jgi:competence protein ComEC
MAVISLRETSGAAIPGASGAIRASAAGELPVFFPEENAGLLREFGRGAVVFAGGNLRPASRETGDWLFSADSLHVVKPAPALERFRTGLRLDLIRRFDAESAGSWGGLALALLLGIRDNLDSGLSARYRDAGCSHVLALSGMHLAVLAGIIAFALTKALGKKPAALAGALCITGYCFIVGPLPSLTRAALMYLLGTVAVLGALKRETLSLLGMAFLTQLLISPGAAVSPSFILSYTALAGILSAGTALYNIGRGRAPPFLLGPLSASAGAFLATAPVTALFFGILRPVGILSGLFLVPLTTVFMLFAIAWLVLNLISPALSTAAAVPLSLLYSLMEKTVSLAGRLPGLAAPSPLPVLVICAGLWICIIWFAYRRQLTRNRLSAFD